MTSFILILAIHGFGVAFALGLGAWLSSRASAPTEVQRLAAAVERAGSEFLWAQFRRVGAVIAGLLVLGAIPVALWGTHSGSSSDVEVVMWFGISLITGAATACWTAHFASRTGMRAAGRVAAASATSTDGAMALSARAGGAVAVVAESASALGFLGLVFVAALMVGGSATEQVEGALRLSIGHALGSSVAALMLHRASSLARGAVGAGGSQSGLTLDDARNPAAVAHVIGRIVAGTVSAASDLFVTATLGNWIAAAVALHVLQQGDAPFTEQPEALIALPFLVRAFGVVSTAFAAMVVRLHEREDPSAGLSRGVMVGTVIQLGGAGAAAAWLGGAIGIPALILVVLLVLVGALGSAWGYQRVSVPRSMARRDDASLVTIVRVLSRAMRGVPLPLITFTAVFSVAMMPVEGADAQHTWWMGLVALSALLAMNPLLLTVQVSRSVVRTAEGALAIVNPQTPARARAERLAQGHERFWPTAQAALQSSGSVAALAGAAVLMFTPLPAALGSLGAAAVWCALLGGGVAVAFLGSTWWAAARGAERTAEEVGRQLAPHSRSIPPGFAPSYLGCIESLRAETNRGFIVPLVFVAGVPLLMALPLRASHGQGGVAAGLAAFLVVMATAGWVHALAADAAAAALGPTPQRISNTADPSRVTHLSTTAGALLRSCAGVGQILAKAVVMSSLTYVALFT